ncbi:uncharacterized protein LOC143578854 [Bidens hawaiensis]|uniref:uncharacterized protein LOC143578854 n=1 Tax=Bidens hawaiensis TaxID=980011 RepID=UPI00404B6839
MEAQKFTMLNEIDVLKTSPSTLKVRVLKLWSIKDNKNVNEDFLKEMVLMDEDENRIQATIYKQGIFRFRRFLKESSTLTIVNPSSNASNVKDKNKRTMEICDLSGNCVYLTLWDHYASELSKYVIEHFDEGQAIIVLQFGRVKYYTGSDGKEKVLLALLNGNDVSVRKPIPPKSIIILGTIKAICPDMEWYYIGCNTCTRKLMENNGEGGKEYECKTVRCNVLGVIPIARFKIKIRVHDSTGVVSLTLFDRDVKMLTNKTAKELIDSQNENKVESGGFPAELDCLLEMIFAFKVDVADFNFINNAEDYGINKLTDDTNIIPELQKRQNGRLLIQLTLGASISKFQSSGSVSFKLSDIGDNQTPSSNDDAQDVATDTKGMSTSSDDKLKRKTMEVFEVDDDASMSATKLKFKTIE